MTEADVITWVKHTLTGDNIVDLETEDSAITTFIREGVRRIKPWYYEPKKYETIPVSDASNSAMSGNSRWFLKSALSKPVDSIHQIYNTQQESAGASDVDSQLYGLQSRMIYTADIAHAAYYQGFQSQLSTFVGNKITWIELEDRVIVSGYFFENRVTVCYHPAVNVMDDMTWDKAITWVKEFALAKSMESAARIRGKFKGGDINMETDADEMIGTVQTMLADLDDKLTTMQLVEVE
jgi:hypothetical protein